MHTETNKRKHKDKHGVPPTKRFSLLGSLVARLEALASTCDSYVSHPFVQNILGVKLFLQFPIGGYGLIGFFKVFPIWVTDRELNMPTPISIFGWLLPIPYLIILLTLPLIHP